jgi:hypothetical protein
MSDNKNKRGYQDRSKVSTSEPYEVKQWTKHWGISHQQLTGAIRATGSHGVKTIGKYLKDNNKI